MLNLDATKKAPPVLTPEQERAQIAYRGYTQGQLSDAFDLVKPEKHWKYPISRVVENPTQEQRDLIGAAVTYYTGSTVVWRHFETVNGVVTKWHAKAAGYFNTIGA